MAQQDVYLTLEEYDRLPESTRDAIEVAPRRHQPVWVMVDQDIADRIHEERAARQPRDEAEGVEELALPAAVRIASGLIWPIFVAVVPAVGLVVEMIAYGPVVACYVTGGEPAMNAFGAEWCEKDGDGELDPADTMLRW